MKVDLRQLQTIEELRHVQQLESKIWKSDPIPIHQTLTAVKNGGVILGAFNEEEIVAFSYGFPGFCNGKAFLCSHMLGVDLGYQKLGIGYQLNPSFGRLGLACIGKSKNSCSFLPCLYRLGTVPHFGQCEGGGEVVSTKNR